MIRVEIAGLPAAQAALTGYANQIPFAAARALTVTAHAVNREIRAQMAAGIEGGATPYALRAFAVQAASKTTLTAIIGLRTAQQSSGTPYEQSIGHLFSGGQRSLKRIEQWLRARDLIPPGLQIAPGPAAPIDARGNVRRAALSEMLGVLESARRGLRNLRVYRKVGRGKMAADAIGFFVAWPNAQRSRHLQPGIYRRIERGADSAVQPWFFFVAPPPYSRRFDLESIARPVVAKGFAAAFAESLEKATASSR